MADRDTGLGDSLLLKRTEPAGPAPVREETPRHEQPQPVDGDAAARPAAPRRRPRRIRDRCTIYLDPDVNKRLDLVARIERKERSEVVTEILRQHLPSYRIDLQ
jgi:hypothetical protein